MCLCSVDETSPHRLIQTISKSKLQTELEMKTIANRVQLLKRQDERMQYQIRKQEIKTNNILK